MAVNKVFKAPSNVAACEAYFCIDEDSKNFYGYEISDTSRIPSIKIRVGPKKEARELYINCGKLICISKQNWLEQFPIQYHLGKIRKLINSFNSGTIPKSCISAKNARIESAPSEKAKEQRKNPENHKKLKELIIKREIASMNNDKETLREIDSEIINLKKDLGYTISHTKKPSNAKVKATNAKPFQGGGFSPR